MEDDKLDISTLSQRLLYIASLWSGVVTCVPIQRYYMECMSRCVWADTGMVSLCLVLIVEDEPTEHFA